MSAGTLAPSGPAPLAVPAVTTTGLGSLGFHLPVELEATRPPELDLGRRDAVRMMVSIGVDAPVHAVARELPDFLDPGDVVVINTSATVPAAVDAISDDGRYLVVHLSTELPTGLWLVELREPVDGEAPRRFGEDLSGTTLRLPLGGRIRLLGRMPSSVRLWVAELDLPDAVPAYLAAHGRPIRYHYVPATWPIDAYRNSYATEPGSAEMPSAGRPLTAEVITALVARGVAVVPLVLHTGVASLEANELPYPERYRVSPSSARSINQARAAGGRVIAIGTTVVRALETVADTDGVVHPGHGWTELVVTPERGVVAVDGLLTGWHEPEATHLLMLEAVAGRGPLELAYPAAVASGYHWHEFGDVHLLLPGR